MKKSFIKATIFGCIVFASLTSCNNSPAEKEVKVEEAAQDLVNAQKDFEEATADSINDHNEFIAKAEARLKENDEKIANLKADMKEDRKDIQRKYLKTLQDLETKNAALRAKVNASHENDRTKWESFKLNVNQEIDTLGQNISKAARK